MKHITLALVAGGTLAASPAFAQDTTDPNAGATTEAGMETPADPNAPAMDPNAAASVDAGATVSTTGWPPSAIDRPYFRAKGKVSAGADFNLLKVSFPDGMGGASSLSLDYFTLDGTYAVSDQLSVGLLYSFSLGLGDGDSAFDGPLALWGGYQIKHDAKLSLAATGAFAVDTGDTDNMGIGLGLGVRYRLADKIALFTGGPNGPGPVGGAGFGGGPLAGLFGSGGHLNISLADNGPITFDIPVGAMFQATPELNIYAMTTLASIALSNSPYVDDMGEEKTAAIFGADYIPLALGGLFAVNEKFDALVSLNLPDLKEAQFDLFVISAGVRAHL